MSLSIRFPIVPQINAAEIIRPNFLVANSRINIPTPIMLIVMVMKNGTGSDREIPLFNAGQISEICSRYLRL